jgi:hypothetical protein
MSNEELKKEIVKVLETIPDEMLEDILEYLRFLIGNARSKVGMTSNLRQIINEDKELLQKLAQ